MKFKSSFLITLICFGFFFSMVPASLAQQEYPTKPITMLVGYAAGGSTDLMCRKLIEGARQYLNNQPIIVENKPGAASSLAASILANAKPDGYTIGSFAQSGMIFVPLLRKVGYNPKKDFEFIMQIHLYPQPFAVRKDNPANSWKEWLEWAKKNVDKATYSTSGAGSQQHVCMLEIFHQENINPPHIPFASSAEVATAVLGGHSNALLDSGGVPYIKSGQLKALAFQNPDRISFFPDVPTFRELGYTKGRANVWQGLFAPAKTPAPIMKKLEEAFTKAAKEPAFVEWMKFRENIIDIRDGATFKKIVETDYDHFGPALKALGISGE